MLSSGQIDPYSEGSKSSPDITESVEEQIDISNVEISNSFVNNLLGVKSKVTEPSVSVVENIETPKVLTEARAVELVSELTDLVAKAKKILQELTSCGTIGVKTSSKPIMKKKKYGYK